VVGPAAAGLLITQIGAADVLLIDSASLVVFALAAAAVRRPLRPQDAPAPARPNDNGGAAPSRSASMAGLARDRIIVATTVAFMAFNVAAGMPMVTGPWLARNHRPGGAAALGAILSAMAAGEIIGAAFAGSVNRGGKLPLQPSSSGRLGR
jgi:hypothetical protein